MNVQAKMSQAKVNTNPAEGIVLSRRKIFEDMPRKKIREGDIVPPDPSIVPVDVAGDLHKLGRVFKSWVKRYFEIQGTKMYYYKNDQKKLCMGYIDLMRCHFIGRSIVASFGSSFELQTEDRVHILAARTESDMNQWIHVIKMKLLPEASKREKKATKLERSVAMSVEPSFQTRRATVKRHRSFMSSRMHRTRLSSSTSAYHEEEEGTVLNKMSDSLAGDAGIRIAVRPASVASDEFPATFDEPVASLPSSKSYHGFESERITHLDSGRDLLGQQPQADTASKARPIEQHHQDLCNIPDQQLTKMEASLSQSQPEVVQAQVLEQPAPLEAPLLEQPTPAEAVFLQQPTVVEDLILEQPAVVDTSLPEVQVVGTPLLKQQQQQSTEELKPEAVVSEQLQEIVVEPPLPDQPQVEMQEHLEQQHVMIDVLSLEPPQLATGESSSPEQLLQQQGPLLQQTQLKMEASQPEPLQQIAEPLLFEQQIAHESEASLPIQPEQITDVPSSAQQLTTAEAPLPELVQQPIESSLPNTSLLLPAVAEDPVPLQLLQTEAPKQLEETTEGSPKVSQPISIVPTHSQLQMQQQQRLLMEEQQRLSEQQLKTSAVLKEEKSAIQQLRDLLEAEEDSFLQEQPPNEQEQPWLQEQNPVDQLKHFLRVCA